MQYARSLAMMPDATRYHSLHRQIPNFPGGRPPPDPPPNERGGHPPSCTLPQPAFSNTSTNSQLSDVPGQLHGNNYTDSSLLLPQKIKYNTTIQKDSFVSIPYIKFNILSVALLHKCRATRTVVSRSEAGNVRAEAETKHLGLRPPA